MNAVIALILSALAASSPIVFMLASVYRRERKAIQAAHEYVLPNSNNGHDDADFITVDPKLILPASSPIAYLPPAASNPQQGFGQLPRFPAEEIMASSKGIMIVGDMGAAKSSIARYLIGNFLENAAVIVFDPHNDPNADWGEAYRITSMESIFSQMQILMASIEDNDTSPIIIVCDEWIQIRRHRLNKHGETKGVADDFISLFSTACRKFNKAAIFVMHSPNVEAAGIDSYLRCNYSIIYLGKIIYDCQELKKYMPSNLVKVAYPCVFESIQYEHPTHGHHQIFRPRGMAPRNIGPVRSGPFEIELAQDLRSSNAGVRQQLEQLYKSEPRMLRDGTGEPANRPVQSLEPLQNLEFSDMSDGAEPLYTDLNLTRQQAGELIEKLKATHNQTQIIGMLWNCTKGQSKAYKNARKQYGEITGSHLNS